MGSTYGGNDRSFYYARSEVTDANVLCAYDNHETVMLSNYVSFHFNEPKMVRIAEQPGPYYLEENPYQLDRFRSKKPWAATMMLPGFIFANDAFVETFTDVLDTYTDAGPSLVTIPVPFYGTDVVAHLLSSSATADYPSLLATPNLVFNSGQDDRPDHEKCLLTARPLVINPLLVSTPTWFRVPQTSQRTYFSGGVADWFRENADDLEIEVVRKGEFRIPE